MPINGDQKKALIFENGRIRKEYLDWYERFRASQRPTDEFFNLEFKGYDKSEYPQEHVSWSVSIFYHERIGHFVEFCDVNVELFNILVPDEADWPDFFVRYVKSHLELSYQESVSDYLETLVKRQDNR